MFFLSNFIKRKKRLPPPNLTSCIFSCMRKYRVEGGGAKKTLVNYEKLLSAKVDKGQGPSMPHAPSIVNFFFNFFKIFAGSAVEKNTTE